MAKRSRLKLPMGFEDALSSLLQVKPPAKEKPARAAKRTTTKKRTAKKR